ncbi:MAG: hypothetical protein LQ338_006395 [Usnochroma carphineum]|nr:MAG: hypothetical protein LQ338_006395 [Usnochroma carphineum]
MFEQLTNHYALIKQLFIITFILLMIQQSLSTPALTPTATPISGILKPNINTDRLTSIVPAADFSLPTATGAPALQQTLRISPYARKNAADPGAAGRYYIEASVTSPSPQYRDGALEGSTGKPLVASSEYVSFTIAIDGDTP